jgi:hypothetical protein
MDSGTGGFVDPDPEELKRINTMQSTCILLKLTLKHRWTQHQIFLSPISEINIAQSDIGQDSRPSYFSPMSDQSDNGRQKQIVFNSIPLHEMHYAEVRAVAH